jgi:hypothetical protein
MGPQDESDLVPRDYIVCGAILQAATGEADDNGCDYIFWRNGRDLSC